MKRRCCLAVTLAALVSMTSSRPASGEETDPPQERPYSGGAVPGGFHTERRPIVPLVIAGLATFAVPYALLLLADASAHPVVAVPVAGPFVAAAGVRGNHEIPNEATQFLYVTMGVLEGAGLALAAVGLVGNRVLVSDDPPKLGSGHQWRLTPGVGHQTTGVALSAVF